MASSSSSSVPAKRVGMVGLGRLGLCTALTFERAGWEVLGAEVSQNYVDEINNKTLYTTEPGVQQMLVESTRLTATTSLVDVARFADIIFIMVATPTGSSPDRAYDCTTLSRVLSDLNRLGLFNKHVVVNCTVPPGYIDGVGRHLLRDCHRTTLSYNPEFIAQGDILRGLACPDIVLIGQGSPEAGCAIARVYCDVMHLNLCDPKFCYMSPASAEITKLAINCFITTKIAFANWVADVADGTKGANADEILQAVGADTRIGGACLRPGFGFGGPCFPRDNRALGQYAHQVGVKPLLPEATDLTNALHTRLMTERLLEQGMQHYVIRDVAYKPGCPVDIIDESQPLEVAKQLVKAGKSVTIRDRAGILELVRMQYGSMFTYEET